MRWRGGSSGGGEEEEEGVVESSVTSLMTGHFGGSRRTTTTGNRRGVSGEWGVASQHGLTTYSIMGSIIELLCLHSYMATKNIYLNLLYT